MKRISASLLAIILLVFAVYAQKPPLDHSVYDGWKSIGPASVSDDGSIVTYELNPQQGDSWLYIYFAKTGKIDSVFCGTSARIAPAGSYVAFTVKPTFAETRQAKKKKLKEDQLPKNSLGIILQGIEGLKTVKNVKSFGVPESGSKWMAYLLEKEKEQKNTKSAADSAGTKKPVAARGKKNPEPKGTELVILNPLSSKEYRYSDVVEYVVARDGKSIGFVQDYPDTTKTETFKVSVFETEKETVREIFQGKGTLKKLSSDKQGTKYSFLFTSDTSKVKVYDLYLAMPGAVALKTVDANTPSMPAGWSVSENCNISFSDDGTRLFFGTAEKPVKEPEDTLLAEEKYRVDIWSWDDDQLQPMQKLQLQAELRKNYLAVFHTDRKQMVQLATKDLPTVRTANKGNSDIALGSSDLKYRKLTSWDQGYSDYYTVNVETGAVTPVLEKSSSRVLLSPGGKFLVWWEPVEKAWFSYNVATGLKKNITSTVKFALYDEEWDTPSDPEPFGTEGWLEGEKQVLIKDRYDIWIVDLAGSVLPVNLTGGYGRKNSITFSYTALNQEEEFISSKNPLLLSSFNNQNKMAGYWRVKADAKADPVRLTEGKWSYTRPAVKAKNSDALIWARGSFEESPEIWLSSSDFSSPKKLSVSNPQQSKYNWGKVELVEWNSFDNKKLQGLLYKPENFDPSLRYPMIVYFYEKSSDGLYSYMPPAPARSIINRVYAASNGYLVFVPDIPYEIGYPGKSCYNAVMSGTYAMLDKYSFIDRERLALDGQSWGGYQIAYLITQTNLFKCAYSGAPVVNMISAYGGIRWGTGMSRMFQYEHTQSRIGGTLWDKPLQFVENSPIFWMPRVTTPVLIMHNDADGAVPWYQGIEFITALRRLGKPAWMLSYNDDDHNLTKRPNMKDLAIRKMQFYDHYLKGAPMPYWMKNGISQAEKGKKDGYELIDIK